MPYRETTTETGQRLIYEEDKSGNPIVGEDGLVEAIEFEAFFINPPKGANPIEVIASLADQALSEIESAVKKAE